MNSKFQKLNILAFTAIVSVLFLCASCFAQEINIGVPLVEQPINFFKSDHPLAKFIVRASSQTLIRLSTNNEPSIKTTLSDSFSVNSGGKSVELRLRSGAIFLNSRVVEIEDLQASLSHCQSATSSEFKSKYLDLVKFEVFMKEQRLKILVKSEQGSKAIFEFLDSCPILEERSLRLFGEDLGVANLILGTGPYQVVSRLKNREVRMERVSKGNAWASVVTMRAFADANHALTAIRTGTLDAFFTQDLEVLAKVQQDPTLLIRPCGVYNLILRTGLEFSCSPFLDPGAIKYSEL